MKLTLSFLIFFISVTGLFISSCDSQNNLSNLDLVELKISSQNEEIQKLIEEFREDNGTKTEYISKKILALSFQSNRNRQQIIQELLKTVVENVDAKTSENYNLWNGAVFTLGELKSVEAVNILSDCLGCNNLVGGYVLERFPAAFAITKIGKPAAPKLLEILGEKPENKELNDFVAAMALSRIYRQEIVPKNERETLNRLERIEPDKSVKRIIQEILADDLEKH